jgi:hypothetical protein
MTFSFKHNFQCQNCRWTYEVTTRGAAMTEPPLLPGGSRTLHSELQGEKCHGLMRFVDTVVLPPNEAKLLNRCLEEMRAGTGAPSKVACEAALATAWQKALNAGKYLPSQSPPEEFWKQIQSAQRGKNERMAALRPDNAREAIDKVISDGAGRDLRTLAVAFDTSAKRWKTGYSAGLGGVVWSRVRGVVQVDRNAAQLKPLVDALNTVVWQRDLGREVWVCAEVDAAAKALLDGWSFSKLTFSAAEYPSGYWRTIEACGHCSQWCG